MIIATKGDCVSMNRQDVGGNAFQLWAEQDDFIFNAYKLDSTIAELQLTAIYQTLSFVKQRPDLHDGEITLYTSYKLAEDAMNGLLEKWRMAGFKSSDRKPIANLRLWVQINELVRALGVKVIFTPRGSEHDVSELLDSLIRDAIEAKGSTYTLPHFRPVPVGCTIGPDGRIVRRASTAVQGTLPRRPAMLTPRNRI